MVAQKKGITRQTSQSSRVITKRTLVKNPHLQRKSQNLSQTKSVSSATNPKKAKSFEQNSYLTENSILSAQSRELIFPKHRELSHVFDWFILICIIIGSLVLLLESVSSISAVYGALLHNIEWVIICIFTGEYLIRLVHGKDKKRFIFSAYGIIDFLAIFPAWLSLLYPELAALSIFLVFRILRVFRIAKLLAYLHDEAVFMSALKNSIPKMFVFLGFIFMSSLILGTIMYTIEGPQNGFVDIPTSMYWVIVTMTTVGYGDIIPHTGIGRFLASLIMVGGFALVAVPTGIVISEYNAASEKNKKRKR
jgi:voltage-gated potassium channel